MKLPIGKKADVPVCTGDRDRKPGGLPLSDPRAILSSAFEYLCPTATANAAWTRTGRCDARYAGYGRS